MFNRQLNRKTPERTGSAALRTVRKSVWRQGLLALLTILLTVVLLFAITSAWYTNIVQTSGLTFEATQWGFDGTILVGEAAVDAAPGDEGIVSLTVTNDSDNMAAVSVNVSKAAMSQTMQQRIYFYVDTQLSRNGEIMDRVYLNNTESYTYTVFSQGSLTLTEQVYNDAQLKWQWVYDVLGYYVLGTKTAADKVSVREYLRPIEYEYDEATTTFVTGEDGDVLVLDTVDGETTLEEFLVAFSQKDGYEGVIDPALKLSSGYYPVDVDEDGYGVWAYLCSYSEIQVNTNVDTQMGLNAANPELPKEVFQAKLTVSGQKSKVQTEVVTTAAALQAALDSGECQVIQLANDITVSGTSIVLENMQQVAIDLNGHTVTSEASVAFDVDTGSQLTLLNGTVKGSGSGYAVTARGAEVTMSNVSVTGVDFAFYVLDDTDGGGNDSKIRLVGCHLNTADVSIYLRGNGSASTQLTQVVVEDSIIESDYIGIQGNGTTSGTGYWGTDVQIINSKVTGYWAGIFQPQRDSFITVSGNSEISGYTGIALKAGTLRILDESKILGTGDQADPGFSNSGYIDTGDAVYIETNYDVPITLEVYGSSQLDSVNGYAIQVYDPAAENVTVKLYGGIFKNAGDLEKYQAFLADNAVIAEDGTRFVVSLQEPTQETTQPSDENAE